jgi:hypothetical protein
MKFLRTFNPHIYYMRELALAIIEDDKERAKKTLADIDKRTRTNSIIIMALLSPFIIIFVLYMIYSLFR